MSASDTKSVKRSVHLVHRAIVDALGLRRLQDQRAFGAGTGNPLRSVGSGAAHEAGVMKMIAVVSS